MKHMVTIAAVASALSLGATVIFTERGTRLIVQDEQREPSVDMKTTVKRYFSRYWPAGFFGLATLAGIITVDILGKKQNAAYAALYASIAASYKNYISKNIELNGIEAHRRIIQNDLPKIPQQVDFGYTCDTDLDVYEDDSIPKLWYIPGHADVFSTEHHGQYFRATYADVIKALYFMNRQYAAGSGKVYFNTFFDFLGLESDWRDARGWDAYENAKQWIDAKIYREVTDDGLEVYILELDTPTEIIP